jgi:hypothetical protein
MEGCYRPLRHERGLVPVDSGILSASHHVFL